MLPGGSDSSSLLAEQAAADPNHTSSSEMGIPMADDHIVSPSSASSSVRGDHLGSRASSPLSDLPTDHEDSVLNEPLVLSGDNDSSASEFDAPVIKKAKSNKGKATTKAKKTLKKTRKSNKGKGKARQFPDPDEASDSESPVKPKQLIAKRSEWRDIPKWADDRCPIFSLGVELLDRCFDVTHGLEVLVSSDGISILSDCQDSDYLALAGVSRFFRHHLNEDFFAVRFYDFSKRAYDQALRVWHGVKVLGPDSEMGKLDVRPVTRPFSRTIKNMYTPMPVQSLADYGLRKHYRPRGPRSQWTRSQYTVYKEEKKHCLTKTRRRREMEAELKELHAERQEHEVGIVEYRYSTRTVLATIPGRIPGEAAVTKDSKGLPIFHPAYDVDLLDYYGEVHQSDGDATYCEDSIDVTSESEAVEDTPGTLDLQSNEVDWAVPDTDEEESDSDLLFKVVYTPDGDRVCHDFWPSEARRMAALDVRRQRITKSIALSTYKVTEAELITLKHYLITNPRSSRSPQQLFSRAAVRALAFRSHGGPAGHQAHLAQLVVRANKARETRKKNGTLRKKKKGCSCPIFGMYRDHAWWCVEESDWGYFSDGWPYDMDSYFDL